MIEACLFSKLSTTASLSSVVSSRIFPLIAPENTTLPFVTYQIINSDIPRNLNGRSGVRSARFQINAFANSYLSAAQIIQIIKDVLCGSTFTEFGIKVSQAAIYNDFSDYEKDTRFFRKYIDLELFYSE